MGTSCANCDAALGADDFFCTFCGAPAPTSRTGAAATGRCPTCAVPLQPGLRFCTSCGRQLGADQPAQAYTPAVAPHPVGVANPAGAPTPAEGPATPRPKRLGLALAILGVVAAVGALATAGLTDIGGWSIRADDEAASEDRDATTRESDDDQANDDEVADADADEQSTTTTVETTTSTALTTSTTTPATTAQPSTTIDASVSGVRCSSAGPAFRGTVTGVEDWVTVRRDAALTARELTTVPRGGEVVYFPESRRNGQRFEWMEISTGGRCGWIASKFVKDVGGQVVGYVDAVDYVHRALRGLEPEALYATWTYADPSDPDREIPIDPTPLREASQQLRQLYLAFGSVDSAPDPDYGHPDNRLAPGCEFSHFLYCGVILLDGAGRQVGRVDVSYVGNGLTDVTVDIS